MLGCGKFLTDTFLPLIPRSPIAIMRPLKFPGIDMRTDKHTRNKNHRHTQASIQTNKYTYVGIHRQIETDRYLQTHERIYPHEKPKHA